MAYGRKDVYALSVFCDDVWLGSHGRGRTCHAGRYACFIRMSRAVRWLYRRQVVSQALAMPVSQHGPGTKHTRKIALEDWQQDIVAQYPRDSLRGLFHSDGCRSMNNVRHRLPGDDRWCSYPRYFFSNKSLDILEFCGNALDSLGTHGATRVGM